MLVTAAVASWRRLRLLPLSIGALSLVLGLYGGFMRLGIQLPGGAPSIADFHGAFMISGFLGTVICLERAVALGRRWVYVGPFLSSLSLGAIALLIGTPRVGASSRLYLPED